MAGDPKCPECASTKIEYDAVRGERVCSMCGLVIQEGTIDLTQEWRAFDESQRSKRVRTGAPLTPTKHDHGITTEIGKGRGELFKVLPKKRAQYYRLAKWHKRLIKSKDRNLSFAFSGRCSLKEQLSHMLSWLLVMPINLLATFFALKLQLPALFLKSACSHRKFLFLIYIPPLSCQHLISS